MTLRPYTQIRDAFLALAPFTEGELEIITGSVKINMVIKDHFIYSQGEIENKLNFILKGTARSYFTKKDAKEITVNLSFENDFVCAYQSFLTQQPTAMNIIAMEHTHLAYWTHDDVQNFYKTIPAFQEAGRKVAESLFVAFIEDWASLVTESAETRYLNLIKAFPQLFQRVPAYVIASYLGIEPQSLSRIRKKLADTRFS